jgi:hypothetical protein
VTGVSPKLSARCKSVATAMQCPFRQARPAQCSGPATEHMKKPREVLTSMIYLAGSTAWGVAE